MSLNCCTLGTSSLFTNMLSYSGSILDLVPAFRVIELHGLSYRIVTERSGVSMLGNGAVRASGIEYVGGWGFVR